MNSKSEEFNWGKITFIISYIFISLPFLVFALGYLKLWISVLVGAIILLSLIFALKDLPYIELNRIDKKTAIKIVVILTLISIWVLLSGIGKIAWQHGDHDCRNGIFEALVNNPWPVGHGYLDGDSTNIGMLVYYIGFWMVPALFGKVFGLDAGYLFQVFWAILGLTLVYFLICIWRKKISVWPLIVFIFFSGMDIILAKLFMGWDTKTFSTDVIEGFVGKYCYNSMNISISAVFNQSIMAWIVVLLLMLQKNHRSMIFLWSLVMLSSVFPFIGLIPLVCYWIFNKYKEEKISVDSRWISRCKAFIKSICTFQNLIGGGTVGIISFLYLKGNNSGQIIGGYEKVQVLDGWGNYVFGNFPFNLTLMSEGLLANVSSVLNNSFFIYSSFILLKVGVYFIIVFKRQKKNPLFYIIVVSLMVIPFIQIGTSIDFCMRASIPGILMVYLFVIEYLDNNKKDLTFYILICILLISSLSAFHEMGRAIKRWDEERRVPVRVEDLCGGGNFGGSPNTFFFKKLAKELPRSHMGEEKIEYCDFTNDEFYVVGPSFSVDDNSLVADEIIVEMDRSVSSDIIFQDGGMLDDNLVSYKLYVNKKFVGELNYNTRQVIIPEEYFNEYAQKIHIVINMKIKLYASDSYKMYPIK